MAHTPIQLAAKITRADRVIERLEAVNADLLEALKFYVVICGNTAASVRPIIASAMYHHANFVIAKATQQETKL